MWWSFLGHKSIWSMNFQEFQKCFGVVSLIYWYFKFQIVMPENNFRKSLHVQIRCGTFNSWKTTISYRIFPTQLLNHKMFLLLIKVTLLEAYSQDCKWLKQISRGVEATTTSISILSTAVFVYKWGRFLNISHTVNLPVWRLNLPDLSPLPRTETTHSHWTLESLHSPLRHQHVSSFRSLVTLFIYFHKIVLYYY